MSAATELPVTLVRGTEDALPETFLRLGAIEERLLQSFERSGYQRLRTPILERSELHERKSGVRIVSKLDMTAQEGVCLRPELTAGIVRAFAFSPEPLATPWRVAYSGPVFRRDEDGDDKLREFHQVGVELIGAERPSADGEVIWLADTALSEAGITNATIRIGHVGLIREVLQSSRLPVSLQVALVEVLSESVGREEPKSTEDRVVAALEHHLEELSASLEGRDLGEMVATGPSGGGAERLFASLYPNVVGRRSGQEIVDRLRRKWNLDHALAGVLEEIKLQVHRLADLNGPALAVLARLERDFAATAPESVAALKALVGSLKDRGVDLDRVRLDLGFGRGIGFYSQMMFVLIVDTPEGPVEVCGGGRYDGLARELGSNRDDRGVGFAFGLERLDEAFRMARVAADPIKTMTTTMVVESNDVLPQARELLARLRSNSIPVVLDLDTGVKQAEARAKATGRALLVVETSRKLRLFEARPATDIESPLADLVRRFNTEASPRP